jgi:hypothetical protein
VDVGQLLDAAWPYLTTVLRTYGAALVQRVTDQSADVTADATVSIGRRLWRRLFNSASSDAMQLAVQEAGEHPGDEDYLAGLRLQVKKTLAGDEELATELAQLLAAGGASIAAGERSVVVRTNSGIISTGDHATNQL